MRSLFLFICLGILIHSPSQNQPSKQVYKRKMPFNQLVEINGVYHYNNKPFTGSAFETFDDKYKTTRQEFDFVNGILHGKKIEYFPGGKLKRAVYEFKNGQKNGQYILYNDNGNIKEIGKYTNELLDSNVVAFYKNGNKKYEFYYEMGIKKGKSVTYFSNGNIEQSSFIVNGVPEGLVETYYEAGNIRQKAYYKDGFRHGPYERYHLTGIKAEESYYYQGYMDSVSYFWDNVFGTKLKQEYYNKGKKEGTWINFNQFGDTLSVYNYKNDKFNGSFRKYAENFKIEDKTIFKSNPTYKLILDEYGFYIDGKLDGIFKAGLYNKEKHVEGTYKNGQRIGEWKYYNKEDKIILIEKYNDDGTLLEEIKY